MQFLYLVSSAAVFALPYTSDEYAARPRPLDMVHLIWRPLPGLTAGSHPAAFFFDLFAPQTSDQLCKKVFDPWLLKLEEQRGYPGPLLAIRSHVSWASGDFLIVGCKDVRPANEIQESRPSWRQETQGFWKVKCQEPTYPYIYMVHVHGLGNMRKGRCEFRVRKPTWYVEGKMWVHMDPIGGIREVRESFFDAGFEPAAFQRPGQLVDASLPGFGLEPQEEIPGNGTIEDTIRAVLEETDVGLSTLLLSIGRVDHSADHQD